MYLDPLPCWRHLPIEEARRRVKDLIRDIERGAAAARRATEKPVRGAEAVMEMYPQGKAPKRAQRAGQDASKAAQSSTRETSSYKMGDT